MKFVDHKEILTRTDGGLDIIKWLYSHCPNFDNALKNPSNHFKIRPDDKSNSANIFLKEGIWLVTDFGDDQVRRNGISCYQKEYNVDFLTAVNAIASHFGIIPDAPAYIAPKSEYTKRPATDEEKEGNYFLEIKKSYSNATIETIISKQILKSLKWDGSAQSNAYTKIASAFKKYNVYELEWYAYVKDREYRKHQCTADFPILMIDEGHFKKVYAPKADKKFRFRYLGELPDGKDFFHGLKQLKADFEKKKADKLENSQDEEFDTRIDQAIVCSGMSDAINVYLAQTPHDDFEDRAVLWGNSETKLLPSKLINEMKVCAKNSYQLMDADKTGEKNAFKNAMEYTDLLTIDLPSKLAFHKDFRGNTCKDVRDFLNYYSPYEFNKSVTGALPMRIYNQYTTAKGDVRYEVDNVQLYNFLQKHGFYLFRPEEGSTDFVFINVKDNVVKMVETNEIRAFIKENLRSSYASKSIRNMVFKSPQLGDSSLTNLDYINLNFINYNRYFEFFFFRNLVVKITDEKIETFKNGYTDCAVWEDKIKQHDIRITEAPFEIKIKGEGDYDISIQNTNCLFFRYLINCSRIHWRKELEEEADKLTEEERFAYLDKNKFAIDGSLLSYTEISDQKFHLINKLFAFGYMLHRYKSPIKPWMVVNMDGRISEDESHGGSGKSVLWGKALSQMKKNFFINAREPDKLSDKHKYDGVSEHTDYIFVEDAEKHTKMNVLYNDISNDIYVNPKNKKPFVIPYSRAPKMVCTTNYAINDSSSSTFRRLLFVEHSDYYHEKGNDNFYREKRDIAQDVGKMLFEDDFTKEDWNNFYNTCFYALKFYLSVPNNIRISANMGNVYRRNLLTQMGGEAFKSWAELYFTPDKLNTEIQREVIQEDYQRENKQKAKYYSPINFKKNLDAYCKYMDYELNPKEMHNTADGRIIKYTYRQKWNGSNWVESTEQKAPIEHFYIKGQHDFAEEPDTVNHYHF